jgi:hypothetical protein
MTPTKTPSTFRRMFSRRWTDEDGRTWIDAQGWWITLAVGLALAVLVRVAWTAL